MSNVVVVVVVFYYWELVLFPNQSKQMFAFLNRWKILVLYVDRRIRIIQFTVYFLGKKIMMTYGHF